MATLLETRNQQIEELSAALVEFDDGDFAGDTTANKKTYDDAKNTINDINNKLNHQTQAQAAGTPPAAPTPPTPTPRKIREALQAGLDAVNNLNPSGSEEIQKAKALQAKIKKMLDDAVFDERVNPEVLKRKNLNVLYQSHWYDSIVSTYNRLRGREAPAKNKRNIRIVTNPDDKKKKSELFVEQDGRQITLRHGGNFNQTVDDFFKYIKDDQTWKKSKPIILSNANKAQAKIFIQKAIEEGYSVKVENLTESSQKLHDELMNEKVDTGQSKYFYDDDLGAYCYSRAGFAALGLDAQQNFASQAQRPATSTQVQRDLYKEYRDNFSNAAPVLVP